jgi:hypothetical protein
MYLLLNLNSFLLVNPALGIDVKTLRLEDFKTTLFDRMVLLFLNFKAVKVTVRSLKECLVTTFSSGNIKAIVCKELNPKLNNLIKRINVSLKNKNKTRALLPLT